MANYNLFDAASLAMVPTGIKDGKLYSVKPDDGSGDFTFSRGTNLAATRVNADGLIEKGRENLLLQSNSFDTTWVNTSTTETGGQTGYDGSSDAWLLDKSADFARITQSVTNNGVQTYSVYAKAGSLNYMRLRVLGTLNAGCFFDFTDGSVVSNDGFAASMVSVGGGWYRCSYTFDSDITEVQIFPANSGSSVSGGSGNILIQDAQLERGLVATDYIETTTAPVQAGITEDLPRIDYTDGCGSLLLEPSRTNLFTYSEHISNSFWIDDQITRVQNTSDTLSPEGVYNAVKLTERATDARHRIAAGAITLSSVDYSASVFLKKGTARYGFVHLSGAKAYTIVVDLEDGTITDTATNNTILHQSVEDCGNGWYRCSVAGNMVGSTSAYIVQFGTAGSAEPTYNNYVPIHLGSTSNNIYAYGAQVEAGSYPTSYIPTYGTSQTRLGGMFSNTSLNLQDDGILGYTWTFLYDNTYVDVVRDAGANLFQIESVTTGEYVRISLNSDGTYRLQDGDGTIANSSGNKILGRYDGTKVEFFVDGASVGSRTSTAGRYSDLDRFQPSTSITKIVKLNQLLFFPTALTDSECEALTRPYDTYQEWVDGEGLTWESKSCTVQNLVELQNL